MRLEAVVREFRERPVFETRELRMLFDEPAPQIQARLSRWVRQGALLQLRKGIYALRSGDAWEDPSSYYVSNCLYRPSYVSFHSALEFHGLIPEATGSVEAATTKHSRHWETPLGRFGYHTIARARFWGYREYTLGGRNPAPLQGRFLLATPEKALLDFFYQQPGEWTEARIREMRFEEMETVSPDDLVDAARRFGSPRVKRAVGRVAEVFFGRGMR